MKYRTYLSLTFCVATLVANAQSLPGLTNGLVSYWPLDEVQGTKTPDVVHGYDFELGNLTTNDIVTGRWGKAIQFSTARQTILERVHLPTDALPINKNTNFTVSFWVNGPENQQDFRIFTEGYSQNNTPWFSLGTPNNGMGGSLDIYLRNDANANSGHRYSTQPVLDGAWHHVVYVQRDVDGVPEIKLYVDGVEDGVQVTVPAKPTTLNTTSVGAARRSNRQWFFTGAVDDVAVWNRALALEEIAMLNTNGTPNPGAVAQPLAIRSFIADLPAVAIGHSNTLRWDVSKDATAIEIDQGIGNVLSNTVVGLGSITIPITISKTYKLTVRRGTNEVTAQTAIAAIAGIAPGWALLDNFDRSPEGPFNAGYWSDTRANAAITAVAGNPMLDLRGTDHSVILPLRQLTISEGQARTLFARLYVQGDPLTPVFSYLGVTDRSLRYFSDFNDTGGFGPCIIPNNQTGAADLMIGVRNGVWGNVPPDNLPPVLESNQIYSVWIDITNGPPVAGVEQGDHFTVYIQKENDSQRTQVFADYVGNRNPAGTPAGNGGDPAFPNLDKLMVGNNTANALFFDDFYISTSGLNTTVPHAFGFTTPFTGVASTLSVGLSAGQVEIRWTAGTLESASLVNGTWSAVQGAAPPSYKTTPDGTQKYFRVRQ